MICNPNVGKMIAKVGDMFDWTKSYPKNTIIWSNDHWVSKGIEHDEKRISGESLRGEICKKWIIAAKIIGIILLSLPLFTIPVIAYYNGYQFVGRSIRELYYDMKIRRLDPIITDMDDHLRSAGEKIDDMETYVSNNQSMQILCKSIPRGAFLTRKPTLMEFKVGGEFPLLTEQAARKEGYKFQVLNYTKYKIEVSFGLFLQVSDILVSDRNAQLTLDDYQIIAYQYGVASNQIFFSQKKEASPDLGPDFYIDLNSFEYLKPSLPQSRIFPPKDDDVKTKSSIFSEQSYQFRILKIIRQLLLGLTDKSSTFYSIPREIVFNIFQQYEVLGPCVITGPSEKLFDEGLFQIAGPVSLIKSSPFLSMIPLLN